jgi:transposase-like protein/IS1 family transposase
MDPQQQFCPNMACPARGKVGKNNIVVHSRKDARYRCKICGTTFTATIGTPFYRLHHPAELMVIVATLIAYGCPPQAIVAAFQLDERTVADWQERSGRHCQQVHEHLVQQPRDLEHVQGDEIRVKGQGKVVWLAMAIMVRTRLWLGGVIGERRDEHLIVSLVQIIRICALARPLLICTDGFKAYVQAIQLVFRSPLPNGKRGRPRLISWSDIHIGQVVKRYQGKRVVDVARRLVQGRLATAQALLVKSHGGTKLNSAFIERLNATFRSRLAVLVRRSRALIRNPETLEPLMYLMGCVYNFCTEHKSLRLPGIVGGHKWIARTPAIAAGLTDHVWTVKELLLFRVPLPGWQPPKHRGRRSQAETALIARWCT